MSNNSNCTLVFYFGVAILSLILVLAIPQQIQYNVFAQDEEKEEEKEEEEQQEEESGEDDSSSKDEEKEEKQESSGEEEQSTVEEVQPVVTTEEPTLNLTNDQLLNLIPVQNTAVEEPEQNTETATPIQKQFNATCSCFTASTTEDNNIPLEQPQQPIQQIPISNDNIIDSTSLGQVKDDTYTGYYTVSNLLDNKVDDTSFWSQAGNSGFTIQLDNTLNDYQVCSMELNNIHDPKNVPYFLDIGVSKNYTGVIDQVNEKIQFDKCVRDMNQIVMMFNKDNLESTDFISIGEIKLFGSKIGAEEETPTPTIIHPQPVLEPVSEEKPATGYENATRINIQDSTAEIDIKNSTVTFKFDPMTATFVQQ